MGRESAAAAEAELLFLEFVFLVILAMMLFLSAALLLPSRGEDEQFGLRRYFKLMGDTRF